MLNQSEADRVIVKNLKIGDLVAFCGDLIPGLQYVGFVYKISKNTIRFHRSNRLCFSERFAGFIIGFWYPKMSMTSVQVITLTYK